MGRKRGQPKDSRSQAQSKGSLTGLRSGVKGLVGGGGKKKRGKPSMVSILIWTAVIFALIFWVLSKRLF